MDEAGRLNELNKAAESDQLRRVHLYLREPGHQAIGELVVARQEAESQRADGIGRPSLEQREE